MTRMPGTARCARAVLVVVGASSVAAAVWLSVVAATFRTGAFGELVMGLLFIAVISLALLSVASLFIAARFAGGGKVRVGALVVGWVIVVGSAVTALTIHGGWGAGVAVGGLLTVLATRQSTRDWFDRPRLVSSAAALSGGDV